MDIKEQIAEKKCRLHALKNGAGFQLGQGVHAKREATRRREEIKALERQADPSSRGAGLRPA